MIAIPRIGQEVIVEFLEGDPDRPIITGRVYNADQMPPYALPANMTQTGIKTRSTKGGGVANFNEIRFEDKKGAEQLYIHAERNQHNVVEKDETTQVGGNETMTIGANCTIQVGGKHTETITKDTVLTVTEGHYDTTVKAGNQTTTVEAGTQATTVKGHITVTSQSGEYTLSAAQKITLQVGGSSIVMDTKSITLISARIDLNP
jgi:type VI secretion system secreted protein VgrG